MKRDLTRDTSWYGGTGPDSNLAETEEWIEAFDDVVDVQGDDRARFLLEKLIERGYSKGVELPFTANTPYINTIPISEQPEFPGDRKIERRIKSIIRWNAMAMVVRANKLYDGIGGHISTYASAATLYEVGFHHFFKGRGDGGFAGDMIYFQGHASPGIYARSYLEGRFEAHHLEAFRRELAEGGGLASYPHPWLMPDYWEFPTVSMGLAPISSIYQARFNRYLQHRGIVDSSGRHVWAFLGDGETDEPETLGALTLATRERLDNLIWVVNCNLQRLDGPVRGNGKIIQELETVFRGAGWNVIKVVWGDDWDPLLENDTTGLLVKRMNEVVDGQFQKYSVESGEFIRNDFFGKYDELKKLVEDYSDEELQKLRRGGHDPEKVYAAYKAAVENEGSPTVILAKTIKGYGLGEAGEGKNITHQQKKLNQEEMMEFRDRFDIPVPDDQVKEMPFYRPEDGSEELEYLRERRHALGGYVPSRTTLSIPMPTPDRDFFEDFYKEVDREVSTTMVFVQMLRSLLKHEELGEKVVPIVPDEARTFGMESLFRQYKIYASQGQLYEPVDAEMLLSYSEARDGQILEEGITEAGSMCSFTAAATAYANHGVDMIPFFIFYSMFGFQRIGDLIWACGDQRGRGFLLGATSGRTTLNGEGLQHEDGHSHVLASTVPNLLCYDPAFHYEIALVIQDGLRRMYYEREDVFYYITLCNENYPMPAMPEGCEEGVLKGLYKFREGRDEATWPKAHLLGSGSLLKDALRAQEVLAEEFGVSCDVWSAPSYKMVRYEAMECERWNLLHPQEAARKPYVTELFETERGPVVAVSDYMKSVPDQIEPWMPEGMLTLGTDGYGRSDTRDALRRFFEVDTETQVVAVLAQLARRGDVSPDLPSQAIRKFDIDPEKVNPLYA